MNVLPDRSTLHKVVTNLNNFTLHIMFKMTSIIIFHRVRKLNYCSKNINATYVMSHSPASK